MKKTKNKFIFLYFIFLLIIFIITFNNICFSALFSSTPALVDKLNNAFESIKGWLLTLATPAAAVAVGVGVFMKKFSFGDVERIRIAKKLIRG